MTPNEILNKMAERAVFMKLMTINSNGQIFNKPPIGDFYNRLPEDIKKELSKLKSGDIDVSDWVVKTSI